MRNTTPESGFGSIKHFALWLRYIFFLNIKRVGKLTTTARNTRSSDGDKRHQLNYWANYLTRRILSFSKKPKPRGSWHAIGTWPLPRRDSHTNNRNILTRDKKKFWSHYALAPWVKTCRSVAGGWKVGGVVDRSVSTSDAARRSVAEGLQGDFVQ